MSTVDITKMIKSYSIRRQLLKWLLIPMFVLIVLDSSALYHFASKLEQETFDHDLLATANDIHGFLEKYNSLKLVELDRNAQQAFLSDASDKIYYSVKDEFGQTLLGDAGIEYSRKLQSNFSTAHTVFYFSELKHQSVRVISMPETIKVAGKDLNIYIQVAETLNKRNQIEKQTIAWILTPQFALLIAAGILLWIGIQRGLSPLWEVNDALSKRSLRDLEPIKLDNVPEEVTRLVDSINELMAKLNQAIHSQNIFLADAAHQLRTPLAGTRAQIELANQSKSIPEIKGRLAKISISTERLIHLINQLLILAKNQPETIQQTNFEEIDLVDFVKKIACEFDLDADMKSVDLSYTGTDECIMINGEKSGLHNLIFNLIDNAIRYTPNSGKVTISVFIVDARPCLVVEDNGTGIPRHEQEMVFERFYRGSQTTAFGTGLGLAIVKEIAILHNATIRMESSNTGTKISVFF